MAFREDCAFAGCGKDNPETVCERKMRISQKAQKQNTDIIKYAKIEKDILQKGRTGL